MRVGPEVQHCRRRGRAAEGIPEPSMPVASWRPLVDDLLRCRAAVRKDLGRAIRAQGPQHDDKAFFGEDLSRACGPRGRLPIDAPCGARARPENGFRLNRVVVDIEAGRRPPLLDGVGVSANDNSGEGRRVAIHYEVVIIDSILCGLLGGVFGSGRAEVVWLVRVLRGRAAILVGLRPNGRVVAHVGRAVLTFLVQRPRRSGLHAHVPTLGKPQGLYHVRVALVNALHPQKLPGHGASCWLLRTAAAVDSRSNTVEGLDVAPRGHEKLAEDVGLPNRARLVLVTLLAAAPCAEHLEARARVAQVLVTRAENPQDPAGVTLRGPPVVFHVRGEDATFDAGVLTDALEVRGELLNNPILLPLRNAFDVRLTMPVEAPDGGCCEPWPPEGQQLCQAIGTRREAEANDGARVVCQRLDKIRQKYDLIFEEVAEPTIRALLTVDHPPSPWLPQRGQQEEGWQAPRLHGEDALAEFFREVFGVPGIPQSCEIYSYGLVVCARRSALCCHADGEVPDRLASLRATPRRGASKSSRGTIPRLALRIVVVLLLPLRNLGGRPTVRRVFLVFLGLLKRLNILV
mmetsp:Transcript_17394/g.47475  ORF Transcript_17394/g.47475 Transcript_17394/m.47475 type:complete len:573 (-) Transcript_17394:228-1946(-)